MASGGCCRSPSMTTAQSPPAYRRPAATAISLPKLRLKTMALQRGSRALTSASTDEVASLEPSSTKTTSQGRVQAFEGGGETIDEPRQAALLVEDRDDDRQQTRLAPCLSLLPLSLDSPKVRPEFRSPVAPSMEKPTTADMVVRALVHRSYASNGFVDAMHTPDTRPAHPTSDGPTQALVVSRVGGKGTPRGRTDGLLLRGTQSAPYIATIGGFCTR